MFLLEGIPSGSQQAGLSDKWLTKIAIQLVRIKRASKFTFLQMLGNAKQH